MTVLKDISALISLFFAAVIFSLLFRSKYPPRRTYLIIFAIAAVLLPIGGTLFAFLGREYTMAVTLFTCTIPSLVLFYLLSEYRDGRFFFTFCLSDTTCIWLMQLTNLLDRLFGGTYIALFVSRLTLVPLFGVFLWKKLRRPYLELQDNLPGGWWTITAISAGFYLLMLSISVPVDVPFANRQEFVRILLVLILMPITYLTILGALRRQMLYYEARNKQDLLAAQISGLEGRMLAAQAAEETIRIERHDLRHKLLAVEDMIKRGETEDALAYIHTLRGEVEYAKPEKWCVNPLLDAVFSSFFAQARQHCIRVKARLAIPEELPVDAAELSAVFANALENAIHACAALPEEQRELVCTCISRPSLMFEVSNPYRGSIFFDREGRPRSSDPAHGIGARSISAFCEKHDACCVYEAKDGWFHLKIAL